MGAAPRPAQARDHDTPRSRARGAPASQGSVLALGGVKRHAQSIRHDRRGALEHLMDGIRHELEVRQRLVGRIDETRVVIRVRPEVDR